VLKIFHFCAKKGAKSPKSDAKLCILLFLSKKKLQNQHILRKFAAANVLLIEN